MAKKIVITGGENSGKTSLIPYLFEHLPKYGVQPFIVKEVASTLFSSGINPHEISNLQEVIIKKMISDETIFQNAADHYTGILKPVVFCDRGILDCKVFSKPGEFAAILESLGTNEHLVKENYDSAVHLVTTAEGKEDVFLATFKDNPARQPMTPEQARARDKKLQHAYLGIKKLAIIGNSDSFEMKKRSALKHILSNLGIPVPQEIEHKFLVPKFFSRDDIPVPYETVKLTQYYLNETPLLKGAHVPTHAEKIIERVRVREAHGSKTFIYTVKAFLPGETDPHEIEDFVSEKEFVQLVTYTNRRPIRKERTYFIWENQYFEFDQFEEPIDDEENNILELEVPEKQQEFILPPFIPKLCQTTDPKYRNEIIALNLG